jgi:TetR/AcrR family transcriptional regulator, transcriptional repressor for nem operon
MGRTSEARERLIGTAGDLWHRRSYTDVGVSEICETAGVQKGSFYHFFPSKQDLASRSSTTAGRSSVPAGCGPS